MGQNWIKSTNREPALIKILIFFPRLRSQELLLLSSGTNENSSFSATRDRRRAGHHDLFRIT